MGLLDFLDRAWCPGCNAEMTRIGKGQFAWQCNICGVFNENGSKTR